jgi:hypothetical protein
MPIAGLEPTYFVSEGRYKQRSSDWATYRNMPILPVLRPVTVRTVRSPQPSLAAQRASLTPGKVNDV